MYRRGNGRASRVIARRKMITQALSEVTLSVEFRVYLRNLIATSCIGFAVITSHTLYAQAAPNGAVAAAGTLPTVTLTGAEGEKATVSTAEIATLPRKTITVFDAHTKVQETYGGVLLSDLLTRVNAPLGEKLHGKAMTIRVLAEGSDHYTAMYSSGGDRSCLPPRFRDHRGHHGWSVFKRRARPLATGEHRRQASRPLGKTTGGHPAGCRRLVYLRADVPGWHIGLSCPPATPSASSCA